MITYEFPYNEHIRTLLRLENLALRCLHFVNSDHSIDHQAALSLLFEITEVASRLDLKRDILQDLERVRVHFSRFKDNPEIAQESLSTLLIQVSEIYAGLQTLSGPIGCHIRSNEWLCAIKKRMTLPGGICEFDFPSYHFWANSDAALRRDNLTEWLAPFLQLHEAITLILRLTRESASSRICLAKNGLFQESGGLLKSAQLLRIHLDKSTTCVPEVMATKHMLQVRFMQPDFQGATLRGAGQTAQDIPFEMTLCAF